MLDAIPVLRRLQKSSCDACLWCGGWYLNKWRWQKATDMSQATESLSIDQSKAAAAHSQPGDATTLPVLWNEGSLLCWQLSWISNYAKCTWQPTQRAKFLAIASDIGRWWCRIFWWVNPGAGAVVGVSQESTYFELLMTTWHKLWCHGLLALVNEVQRPCSRHLPQPSSTWQFEDNFCGSRAVIRLTLLILLLVSTFLILS